MKFEYPYEVSREDARLRLDALGSYLRERHGIAISWLDDNKASFSGKYLVVKIEGELTLRDGMVDFSGKDPGMLWRNKATTYLKDKLATYLDPRTPIDKLPRS